MSADQPQGHDVNGDSRPITVRVKADGLDEVFGRLVVGGVEAGLRTVLTWFDTHAYCADTLVWINPEDNDGVAYATSGRGRMVRRPDRQVLVVGTDPNGLALSPPARLLPAETP